MGTAGASGGSRNSIALAVGIAVVLATAPAGAAPPGNERYALQHTSPGFLAIESLGSIAVAAGFSLAAGERKTTCSWCNPPGFDTWVRDGLVASHPRTPAAVSHVLSLGVLPLGAAAALVGSAAGQERMASGWQDLWIAANAVILTTGITDGTKKLVSRQRPGFHYGLQGNTESSDNPLDENMSFFSGDTSWAFSIASSATTLAYLRGYPAAPWVAASSAVVATSVGVLRIAADMHWATDVLTGAAAGTLIGAGVPLLLHARKPSDLPTGLSVTPMVGRDVRGLTLSRMF